MEIAGRIRQGEYFEVDSAKLYDLPPERVSVGAAASGEQSARLAAEHGECLIVNEPRGDVVQPGVVSPGRRCAARRLAVLQVRQTTRRAWRRRPQVHREATA